MLFIFKGYSFTTSVSIRLLPGLGDDIFTHSSFRWPKLESSATDSRSLGLYRNCIFLHIGIRQAVVPRVFALHFLSAADSTGSPLPAQLSLTAIYPSADDVMSARRKVSPSFYLCGVSGYVINSGRLTFVVNSQNCSSSSLDWQLGQWPLLWKLLCFTELIYFVFMCICF